MQLSFKAAKRKPQAATLADLPSGSDAVIDRLDLPEDLAGRLMELGFIPGHPVTVAGNAPGGDPRIFRVEGAEIALRRETARHILIRKN